MATGTIKKINKQETLINNSSTTISTSYSSTGKSFTITSDALVKISIGYNNVKPLALGCKASQSSSSTDQMYVESSQSNTAGLAVTGLLVPATYYVWAKASGSGADNISVTAVYL